MKKLKKLAALILTAAMVMGLTSIASFADVGAPILTGLSIVTAVQDGKNISFTPGTTEYTYNVQSDCYGVKVTAMAPSGTEITINGEAAASGESKIITISGDYANYDIALETKIPVTASKNGMTTTYTINVVRDCDTWAYNLFSENTYTAQNGVVMPYELYVPSNYDPAKKYPIVLALHGSGQRTQTTDMVLKRYQMATVFAKDSEHGINQCIVLAPQCKVSDANTQNWTTLHAYRAGVHANPYDSTPFLEAAYDLLHVIEGSYSVDLNRVYVTGLSAGGVATFTIAQDHPGEFAAIAPDAAGADVSRIEALRGTPMWIFQAADDPTMKPDEYYYPTVNALKTSGIYYKTTLYAPGTVFGTSPHFSWVPMYADKEFRNWLFAQSK
ncbi:MAG: cadherin-like beta sandwich domain-containing protein [Eubacteriales bacterium]|nr:cadherin-like beta sandwich domain-containing protein [Eubacteriales bacterium]